MMMATSETPGPGWSCGRTLPEKPRQAAESRLHQSERPSAVADALGRLGYSTRDDEKAA